MTTLENTRHERLHLNWIELDRVGSSWVELGRVGLGWEWGCRTPGGGIEVKLGVVSVCFIFLFLFLFLILFFFFLPGSRRDRAGIVSVSWDSWTPVRRRPPPAIPNWRRWQWRLPIDRLRHLKHVNKCRLGCRLGCGRRGGNAVARIAEMPWLTCSGRSWDRRSCEGCSWGRCGRAGGTRPLRCCTRSCATATRCSGTGGPPSPPTSLPSASNHLSLALSRCLQPLLHIQTLGDYLSNLTRMALAATFWWEKEPGFKSHRYRFSFSIISVNTYLNYWGWFNLDWFNHYKKLFCNDGIEPFYYITVSWLVRERSWAKKKDPGFESHHLHNCFFK